MRHAFQQPQPGGAPPYAVLIPVALASSGVELLRVARALAPPERLRVTALHCLPEEADCPEPAGVPEPLRPLVEAAGDFPVTPVCVAAADIGAGIVSFSEKDRFDLVLMGWHAPMSSEKNHSDPVQSVLQDAQTDVAIYLARQFRPWRSVLVPYFGGAHDRGALELARRIGIHASVKVTILHVIPPGRREDDPRMGLSETAEDFDRDGVRLKIVEHAAPVEAAVAEAWEGHDLIVVGASEVWGMEYSPFTKQHERLAFATAASLLVIHKKTSASGEKAAQATDASEALSNNEPS